MSLKSFLRRALGRKEQNVPVSQMRRPTSETPSAPPNDIQPAPTPKPVSVHYHKLADASDARAASLGIDSPREGRKTYGTRHKETSEMSGNAIDRSIAERQAQGKEVGVLLRVKAERAAEAEQRQRDEEGSSDE